MSIEDGKNNTDIPEQTDAVVDVSLPEMQPVEFRRHAVARPLGRPALGVAGEFANELAARIG